MSTLTRYPHKVSKSCDSTKCTIVYTALSMRHFMQDRCNYHSYLKSAKFISQGNVKKSDLFTSISISLIVELRDEEKYFLLLWTPNHIRNGVRGKSSLNLSFGKHREAREYKWKGNSKVTRIIKGVFKKEFISRK